MFSPPDRGKVDYLSCSLIPLPWLFLRSYPFPLSFHPYVMNSPPRLSPSTRWSTGCHFLFADAASFAAALAACSLSLASAASAACSSRCLLRC